MFFMKKRVFLGLLVAVLVTACEKEEEPISVENAVSGTYAGWTNATAAYFPDGMTNDGDSVVVSAAGTSLVDVQYISSSWGTAKFKGVTVVEDATGYILSQKEGSITITLGTSPHGVNAAKQYDAIFVSGSISLDKKSYTFVVSAPGVMGGSTLTLKDGIAPVPLEE